MTSTAGAMQTKIVRANDIFDPDYTGTGHQPMGFDQWAVLYNHFVVLGSKVTCRFVLDADENDPAYVGVYISDDTTTPYTDASECIESKKGQTKILARPDKAGHVTATYSAKRFYNVTDVKDNVDRLGSTVTASPTEQALFHYWLQGVNETINGDVDVTIEYIVMFSEPKDLAQS